MELLCFEDADLSHYVFLFGLAALKVPAALWLFAVSLFLAFGCLCGQSLFEVVMQLMWLLSVLLLTCCALKVRGLNSKIWALETTLISLNLFADHNVALLEDQLCEQECN